jgi:DNA mismatch endonuclease (patch repair protein)
MDIFAKKKRSEIMSRIRSSGTKPETKLYHCVRATLGGRWRIDRNVRTLPGQPDVVVPRLRLAVFADGCFYHSCPLHGHDPKSNSDYWVPKLARNKARDRLNRRALRGLGFSVWSFWEHDLKDRNIENTTRIMQRRLQRLVAGREVAGKVRSIGSWN